MSVHTPGLDYLHKMLIGMDELQWLQADAEGHRNLLGLYYPGLVQTDRAWEVHDTDDDGAISVRLADSGLLMCIDSDGSPRYATTLVDTNGTEITELTLPNDGTWYTIVVRWVRTHYEPGTLTLNGTVNVTGVGTAFTRYSGYTTDGYDQGTLLRIDAGDTGAGNAGDWEIDTIVSDTSLTLRAAVPGSESGCPFTVQGRFYLDDVPADPDIHNQWVCEISYIARTRTPAAGYFVLADAKRADAGSPNVYIIDRRHQNIAWRRRTGQEPYPGFSPLLTWTGTGVGSPSRQESVVFVGSGVSVQHTAMALCDDGQILAIGKRQLAASDATRMTKWNPTTLAWSAEATIFTVAMDVGIAMVKLPTACGFTHALFYTSVDVLYMRTSTDHGVTWSAATSIWNGVASDAGDDLFSPSAVLLRNGRLVVAACVEDVSVSGNEYIKYIYSDDYGTTWNTNGNAGWSILDYTLGSFNFRPHIRQDPVTGVIYTAAVSGGTAIYYVAMSASEHLPDPTSTTSLASWLTATTTIPYLYYGDMWVDPISGAIVFFTPTLNDGANVELVRTYTIKPTVVPGEAGSLSVLSAIDLWNTDGTQVLQVGFCMDGGGMGMLLWYDTGGTAPADISSSRLAVSRSRP